MTGEILISTQGHAKAAIERAWPLICSECLSVLGSELHYQAMIYHALRTLGKVPLGQLGMNVKQWLPDVQNELFQSFASSNHKGFNGGFEPIPDVVIFTAAVEGDWRRRRHARTVRCMLAAIEVKASERAGKRLTPAEVLGDLRKLAAHREEVRRLGHDFHPIMLVIDSARDPAERMTSRSKVEARALARELAVEWRYASPESCEVE